jgi:hypothetical protein
VPIDVLRVVRKGPAVKTAVDDAIDQCSEVFNLRDSIEESRMLVEQATDERQKKIQATKGWCHGVCRLNHHNYSYESGLQNLRRYFELIVFQSYLQSMEPDVMGTFEPFETFVKNRPGWRQLSPVTHRSYLTHYYKQS